MMSPLAHIVVEGSRPQREIFLCHGILGSARNWLGFVRKWVRQDPGLRVVLVDLRGHGDSSSMLPPHTVSACAADLHALAKHLQCHPSIVVGHSFGGRVALAYADQASSLEQVWVLDATPGGVTDLPDPGIGSVIDTLREVPQPLEQRADVVQFLQERGYDDSISRWMSTNLRRTPEGLVWRFRLSVVVSLIQDYFEQDLWSLVETPAATPEVHLVQAERSDRWTPGIRARLDGLPPGSPTHVHVLPDAGHWVHVDNPQGLLALFEAWI